MNPFGTKEELLNFIKRNVLTTSEAIDVLGISRQALNSLVKRGKLPAIKGDGASTLFLREEVELRKQEADLLREKFRPK